MSRSVFILSGVLLCGSLAFTAGCSDHKAQIAATERAHKHEHNPLHDGVPIVLGAELYHLELVLDPAAGKLQAYVFDSELENFVRTATPSFVVTATVDGVDKQLVFHAVANPATGETVGDTSLFEANADWLKSNPIFDADLQSITIHDSTFTDVKFNYPKGNDTEMD